MTEDLKDLGLASLAVMIAILAQMFVENHAPVWEMAVGGLITLAIILVSMLTKKVIPIKLPLFAYVTLVGIIVCLPYKPLQEFILTYTNKIDFLSCCVGLLAFAGLSVGGRIVELKEHSWKVVLIFLLVSTCCFFGAALVAQIGFTITGVI